MHRIKSNFHNYPPYMSQDSLYRDFIARKKIGKEICGVNAIVDEHYICKNKRNKLVK